MAKALVVLGAVVDLNKPPHYLHWAFVQISWANLGVIIGMIVLFLLAIFVPFPGRRNR